MNGYGRMMLAGVGALLVVTSIKAAVIGELTLDGTSVYQVGEDTVVSQLTVSADSKVNVAAGVTFHVLAQNGSSGVLLSQTGPGNLIVDVIHQPGSRIEVNGGVACFTAPTCGVDTHALAQDALFHVDASCAESIVTENVNGTNFVSRWNDVRGDGHPAALAPANGNPPFVSTNLQNRLPFVDFGGYSLIGGWGGWLNWSQSLTTIREVFIVFSDTEDVRASLPSNMAAPFLLGNTDSFHFHRGYPPSYSILHNEHSSANLRNVEGGMVSLDGVDVHYSTTLPEGFHVIHLRSVGNVTASCFAKDRDIRSGGSRIAEMIAFDALLDVDTAKKLEMTLCHKWLGLGRFSMLSLHNDAKLNVPAGTLLTVGELYAAETSSKIGEGCLKVSSGGRVRNRFTVEAGTFQMENDKSSHVCMDDLHLSAEGALSVGAGGADAYRLSGSDVFVKQGPGALSVRNMAITNLSVSAGSLSVAAFMPAKTAVPWLHLDASSAADIVTNGVLTEAGKPLITTWHDCRSKAMGNPYAYANGTTGKSPWLDERAQNGLPVVDFGGLKLDKPLQKLNGHGGWMNWSTGSSNIREVFLAVSDTPDAVETKVSGVPGQFMLTSSWSYDFHRGYSTPAEIYHSGNTAAYVRGGKTWLDGSEVTPTSTALTNRFHIVDTRTDGSPAKADSFCNDRGNIYGGLRYGEVMVFTNHVSDAERAAITAQLKAKWLGAVAPTAVIGRVTVAAEASVTLPEGTQAAFAGAGEVRAARGGLRASSLAGALSFSGNLDIVDGAVIDWGEMMTVAGSLRLPATGSVKIAPVALADVPGKGGTIPLIAATSATGSVKGWDVSLGDASPRFSAHLSVTENGLVVDLLPSGLIVIIR